MRLLWLTLALGSAPLALGNAPLALDGAAVVQRAPHTVEPPLAAPRTPRSPTTQHAVVVFLVRHAEKVDDSRDPPLSEVGRARADLLADVLRDAGITMIWSTDFQRTRGTAEPLARRLGIEIRSYNPGNLDYFARQLRAMPGRHLVVGHSNTTPDLATALGGGAHGSIDDAEYDRLYSITIDRESVTTALMRFGERYRP